MRAVLGGAFRVVSSGMNHVRVRKSVSGVYANMRTSCVTNAARNNGLGGSSARRISAGAAMTTARRVPTSSSSSSSGRRVVDARCKSTGRFFVGGNWKCVRFSRSATRVLCFVCVLPCAISPSR